jgi:phosphoglycolate phosphatase-like HAD superfamily hydrolase
VNLADYDALSFDCYGTLIDWETGIASVLTPWAREAGLDVTDEELLQAYAENEEPRLGLDQPPPRSRGRRCHPRTGRGVQLRPGIPVDGGLRRCGAREQRLIGL